MTDAVAELVAELERRRGDAPLRASDLLRLVRVLAQSTEAMARYRETLKRAVQGVETIEARLLIVDTLPPEAPLGALIRCRGQAALFLGNGMGQPLSRLVPQAL